MEKNNTKSQRRIYKLPGVPKKLLVLFLILYNVHPAAYFLSAAYVIGFTNFISIGKIILILAPPIIAGGTVAFILLNRKLAKNIDILINEPDENQKKELADFFNSYPFKAAIPLVVGCAGGPVLTIIIGLYQNVFFSIPHALFTGIIGETTALVVGYTLYYYAKVYLYPSNREIEYRPLSLFHKFSIPILSVILIVLTVATIGIFGLTKNDITKIQNNSLGKTLLSTVHQADRFYSKALAEIEAYARIDDVKSMDLNRIRPLLLKLHRQKAENIEIYFMGLADGTAPTSVGKTPNISDRGYFKHVMSTGTYSFSEPIINKATGTEIIVAAVPVKRGGKTVGLFGATILIDTINEKFNELELKERAFFMIVSREGKIMFHPDKEYHNKTIGKDIVDNGDDFDNTAALFFGEKKEGEIITFDGTKYLSFRNTIPTLKMDLILMVNETDAYAYINRIIIRITLALIILSALIYFIIRRLAAAIGRPIDNTIHIFNAISRGDLTVKSKDYLADQFGELLRYLQILLSRLNNIIHNTIESSQQLAEASTALSNTSQNLSQNSQNQAASVEESTAALEETSASIDSIAANAREQAGIAKDTNLAMEELKQIIQKISDYAMTAQEMANVSSSEAKRGNELMEKTIAGMNSIDESTKKISEFVTKITDISDQVNLLSLNASIEAARAGEHGKGFAVVADEIGKLAEETSVSAKNITVLVNEGLSEVSQGIEYVDQTSQALVKIMNNIRETDRLVNQIASGSQSQMKASDNVLSRMKSVMEMADKIFVGTDEQMTANKEMTGTVHQINEVTQSVANGASEVASSAEEIKAQADMLTEQIKFFKVKDLD